eukprot:m.5606 g.5606  ORF g.5606 m.5606 type:complete len:305 (+) comp13644_c0_seq2:36-950(+)
MDPWREVVFAKQEYLRNNLSVDDTLLWRLMECKKPHLLGIEDKETIDQIKVSSKKIEKLTTILSKAGPKQETYDAFLGVLEKDYSWVAKELRKTERRVTPRREPTPSPEPSLPPNPPGNPGNPEGSQNSLRRRRESQSRDRDQDRDRDRVRRLCRGRDLFWIGLILFSSLATAIFFSNFGGDMAKRRTKTEEDHGGVKQRPSGVEDKSAVDMPINDLISVVCDIGGHRWKDIGVALKFEWNKMQSLVKGQDSDEHKLRTLLESYRDNKGDSRETRKKIIDACVSAKIGGALGNAMNKKGFTWKG